MVAQILGAACASLVVYANYKSAIDVYEGMYHSIITVSQASFNSPRNNQAARASAQSHPPQMPPPAYSARIPNLS